MKFQYLTTQFTDFKSLIFDRDVFLAIYHQSAKVITRSKGQSVIACAAYRAGEKLYDERLGEVYDYTKKMDIAHGEILAPENAPEWMLDRQKLWNGVEQVEKRKDAQLAREVQVALPRELTLAQNIDLTREFVKSQFVSKGMVADVNIHMDKASDGELQPHAHILLTMREVNSDGFGSKVRSWNDKANLLEWRQQWADYANKHLALNGHDIRIDHRTLVEQGIDLEPQKKIGTASAYHRMAAHKDHIAIAERNGEKLSRNPEIVLDILTHQQSTFTHIDIARIVNRHTASVDQFNVVFEKVKASAELVHLGTDEKSRERYTTKDMLQLESEMVRNAVNLADRQGHGIDLASIDSIGDRFGLSAEQTKVLDHLVTGGDLRNVVGFAGTGKSRMLGAAKEIWEKAGYQVLGASLSGIAAENLEASSGIESRTLASRFYYWDRQQELLTSKDVLVIDEAGMLGSRQVADVLEEAKKRGAKVVMVGDPEQLQAIEAGAAFRAVAEKTSYIELTEIWRQKEIWQKEATVQFATKQTALAVGQYDKHDCVHEFETQAQAKESMIDAWNDVRIANPEKSQIMLAYTRADAAEMNLMARTLRQSLGELGKDHDVLTARGAKIFSEGDRIYFLKNDRDLGVKNGTLGSIIQINDGSLGKGIVVQLDRDNNGKPITVSFSVERYNELDYGYAATIHKGQGVTVDHTYVLASEYLDRHATYVAMTRHKDSAELFWSKEKFPEYNELLATLSRENSKESTLDYIDENNFACNRGIVKKHEFKIPAGFEDIFTKDILAKINESKKIPMKDFLDNNDYEHKTLKIKDMNDLDL